MQDLVEFLKHGAAFTGCLPGDARPAATVVQSKLVKGVLRHIADRWPTRAQQQARGLHLSRRSLGDGDYSISSVAAALAVLVNAGLVMRVRSRQGRGSQFEDVARTFINPVFINMAKTWADERRSRGRKSGPVAKTTVELPLKWNGIPLQPSNGEAFSRVSIQGLKAEAALSHSVIAAASDLFPQVERRCSRDSSHLEWHPADVQQRRGFQQDQRPIFGRISVRHLDTAFIHTPPTGAAILAPPAQLGCEDTSQGPKAPPRGAVFEEKEMLSRGGHEIEC